EDGVESACQWGGAYAVFGPATRELLAAELGLLDALDPDAVCTIAPAYEACDGDVARRCLRPEEGAARVTVTDCGDLGLTCREGERGVACVDPASPEPPPVRPAPP